eukprot:567350-Prymnesium_polylepis.2
MAVELEAGDDVAEGGEVVDERRADVVGIMTARRFVQDVPRASWACRTDVDVRRAVQAAVAAEHRAATVAV